MPRSSCSSVVAAALAVTATAFAALSVGAKAPDFTLQATQGGKVFTFDLADALKKGPVVLYFYPAAFTTGCTIEAHEFADAIDQYHALGATVIIWRFCTISLDTLQTRFSVSECRSKWGSPVAADTDQTGRKSLYDAARLRRQSAIRQPHVVRHCTATAPLVSATYTEPRPGSSRRKHVERAQSLDGRPLQNLGKSYAVSSSFAKSCCERGMRFSRGPASSAVTSRGTTSIGGISNGSSPPSEASSFKRRPCGKSLVS